MSGPCRLLNPGWRVSPCSSRRRSSIEKKEEAPSILVHLCQVEILRTRKQALSLRVNQDDRNFVLSYEKEGPEEFRSSRSVPRVTIIAAFSESNLYNRRRRRSELQAASWLRIMRTCGRRDRKDRKDYDWNSKQRDNDLAAATTSSVDRASLIQARVPNSKGQPDERQITVMGR